MKAIRLALLFAVLLWPAVATAQCGVYKTWALNEILTSADLNNAFSRTVTANTAACQIGDSPSVGAMQTTVNPYPGGAESLATTVQGEIERLRFQVNAIVGKSFWYQVIDNSLATGTPKHWGATYAQYTQINGVADPASPPAKNLYLYAKDDGAGNTVFAVKQPSGAVTVLTGPNTAWGSAMTVNLKIINDPGLPLSKLDITWDRLSVQGYIGVTQSLNVDFTTTGAGALDTGTVGNALKYYVWAIYNQSTGIFNGLASTSETAPVMPIGYTNKRLIGMVTTEVGSSNLVAGNQYDNMFTFVTPRPVLNNGAAVSAASFDISAHAPSQTVRAAYLASRSDTVVQVMLHWQSFTVSPGQFPAGCGFAGGVSAVNVCAGLRVPTHNTPRTTLYYALSNGVNTNLYVVGWEMQWRE